MRAHSSRQRQHKGEPTQTPLPRNAKAGPSAVIVPALLGLIVVGVTLFAHWPALSARAITIDDQEYLTDNPLVQHPSWASAGRFLGEVLQPSTVSGYYQPLAMISLMLDYAAAGRTDNLRPFHRTSLILHAANTVLVIVLLYMLFGQPWIAAMVGLLFGVHPMTVETIPWIGERKTLLAAFFTLWCLIVYVRYARRPSWKLYATCLVLYVLALMSKPTAVPIPVVLLTLDYWPLRRLSRPAVIEKIPLLLIAGVSAIITVISQHHLELSAMNSFSAGQTFLLMCHNLVFYPRNMIWPIHLSSFYAFPENIGLSSGMLLAGVIVNAAILSLLAISLRWTRAVLAGWLCYFLLLLPTLLNKNYSPSIAWNKYAYLPAVGLLLVLGWLLERVWSSRTQARRIPHHLGVVAVVAVLAGLLVTGTRHYLAHWQTTEKLCDYMLALAPNSYQLYNDLGNVYNDNGDYDRAIQACTRAIELKPDYAFAYNNRGIAYNSKRDFGRAIRDYTSAIESKADFAKAYNNRGLACYNNRDFGQAIRDYTKAIELKGDYAEAYNNRGKACNDIRDFDGAVRDYTKAIELRPDFALAYNNRAFACGIMGNYDRAIRDSTRAIELRPDYAEAYNNRGNAYNNLRDFSQAIRDYTKAVELKPDHVEAYHNRAIAHFHLKEYDKAWADVRMVRRLGGTPNAGMISALTNATGLSE